MLLRLLHPRVHVTEQRAMTHVVLHPSEDRAKVWIVISVHRSVIGLTGRWHAASTKVYMALLIGASVANAWSFQIQSTPRSQAIIEWRGSYLKLPFNQREKLSPGSHTRFNRNHLTSMNQPFLSCSD